MKTNFTRKVIDSAPVEKLKRMRDTFQPGKKPPKVYHQSRWNFFGYYFAFFLIVPLFIVYIKRRQKRLILHQDRLIVEEGIFGRDSKETFITDIRGTDIEQSGWQRILGYGTIKIATSGTAEYEQQCEGMPRPHKIKELINSRRRANDERLKEPETPSQEPEVEQYVAPSIDEETDLSPVESPAAPAPEESQTEDVSPKEQSLEYKWLDESDWDW